MQDEIYMARAMKLAQRGRFTTHPNPNVGCVIVKDGVVVGEGFHYRAGEPHAEVHALRMAGEKARGATAYVTLEPCSHHGRTPPCCEALIAAGVARVVTSMQDPNPQVAGRGLYRLQQEGIDVSHGLMMNDAEALNKGFLKRMRTGFPYIQLKLGALLTVARRWPAVKASGSPPRRQGAMCNVCARKAMLFSPAVRRCWQTIRR